MSCHRRNSEHPPALGGWRDAAPACHQRKRSATASPAAEHFAAGARAKKTAASQRLATVSVSEVIAFNSVEPPPAVDRVRAAACDVEQAEGAGEHHVLLEMRGLHHARVGRRLPEAVRDERATIVKAIRTRLAQLVARPSTMHSPPIVSTRAPSHASM